MAQKSKKLTVAEKEERYSFTIDQLATTSAHEVSKLIQVRYKISPRAARHLITRSRQLAQEYYHVDRQTQINTLIAVLDRNMHSPSGTVSNTACKHYASLLGLNAPLIFATSVTPEDGMADALKDPEVRKLHIEFMAFVEARKALKDDS